MIPKVFKGINVRGLRRPIKKLNVVVLKPLLGLLRSVFGIIV